MPRTRLVWHLFASWCGLIACGLVALSWLSLVEMAQLSDESEYQRMRQVATAAAAAVQTRSITSADDDAWRLTAEQLSTVTNLQFELLDLSGSPQAIPAASFTSTAAEAASRSPNAPLPRRTDEGPLASIRAGAREVRTDSYDAERDQRVLTLFVALDDNRSIRVTSDTADLDQRLRSRQHALLRGFLIAAAFAVFAGYVVSKRAAAGVEDLAKSASMLARGSLDVEIPTPDLAELGMIAAAVTGLRDQLVERGRTIGRQGTQQEAVLASMSEGVLAVDNRHRLLSINTAAASLLGIEPGRMLLRPMQEVIANPDLRRFVLKAIDCQEPVEDDLLLRDGLRERTLLVRGTALRSPRGTDQGAVIVLNDVTHFRHLENVRRDFVANVSHELKTPTASIRGFVETLLDGAIDDHDDAIRFLSIIARQAERLEAIIEDLLALSRIERIEESSDLSLENIALSEVITAAIGSCQLRASERAIDVTVDCDPRVQVAVNPPLFEQALINLIDNAIKYSDTGKTVRLQVGSTQGPSAQTNSITISVADEGCGIDPQFLPRIFERFYRVDRARSRKLGGTGLGLSIVKHIVQAHGGSVDVHSTPGVGSVFSIHLPIDDHTTTGSGRSPLTRA